MAQRSTHEDDREKIMTRVPREVYKLIRARSAVLGISMGQYAGDTLADYFGRPELMRELDGDEASSLAEWRAALELEAIRPGAKEEHQLSTDQRQEGKPEEGTAPERT